MLVNQERERLRGNKIHGSVGVGFGETIERSWVHSSLTMQQLSEWATLSKNEFKYQMFKFLRKVVDEYVMTKIPVDKIDSQFIDLMFSDGPMQDFTEACEYLLDSVDILIPQNINNSDIVFEGAQGLMLDMDYGYFPYVTRSNCGMKNIRNILEQIPGEHTIEVNYVTRAYTTRHGAGPLENEVYELPFKVIDETNVPNMYQGSLRFAPLNLDMFASITNKDFMNYAPRHAIKTTTVTCLDQLYGEITVIKDENELTMDSTTCVDLLDRKFDYITDGPTRSTVQ
jgi:adenylosuccinate synthase